MSLIPNLQYRQKNLIFLTMPAKPQTTAYRLLAHRVLDDAYGAAGGVGGAGADTIVEVGKGQHFSSPSITRRRLQWPDRMTDPTRIIFDPEDYSSPANAIPHDEEIMFLRVQEYDTAAANWLPEGPIKIIPYPAFFGLVNPILTISGSAPGLSGSTGAAPPSGAMHIQLPMFSQSVTIMNLSTTEDILIACGPGQPLMEIRQDISPSFQVGGCNEFFLCSTLAGTAVPFSLSFHMTNFW